jgi:ELWxxDGT repeat protein
LSRATLRLPTAPFHTALALLAALPAQTLVRDLNPVAPSPQDIGVTRLLRAAGSNVFFARATRNEAFELWRSDGTAAGTALVADICPGECSGMVDAEVQGTRIFFVGFDAAIAGNRGLYVSDGTATGTARLTPAAGSFIDPTHLRNVGAVVVFVADTPGAGIELWRTDGTHAGTTLLADIYPGPIGSDPRPLLVSNGVLYFLALAPGSGVEIWRTDGTVAGTRLFCETIAGPAHAAEYDQMAEIGGAIYFGADVAPAGYELWRSDGTVSGTALLKDVNPGAGASYPSHFRAYQGNLLFTAFEPSTGRELWLSDGTTAGTRLLADVQPGSTSSNPSGVAVSNNRVLFAATTPLAGTELWASDGTAAGTQLVRDIAPGTASSFPRDLVPFGAGVVFAADDGARGDEPWFSDGTAAGTRLLADVNPGAERSFPSKPIATPAAAFFFAFDAICGRELWRTDGTTTARVADAEGEDSGSYPRVVLAAGEETYYAARNAAGSDQLWRTDGTPGGTFLVPDPGNGTLGAPLRATLTRFFATLQGDALYFVAAGTVGAARYEQALWHYDPTANVTRLAFGQTQSGSVVPGVGSVASLPRGVLFALLDDRDGRRKLMRYEPATSSVSMLADFGAGSAFDVPLGDAGFVRAGDAVFFAGHTLSSGAELWRSDGTPAGTALVRDLAVGAVGAQPEHLTAFGDAVLFSCRALPGLFRSDGTASGTEIVRSVQVVSSLAAGAGVVVFFADDGSSGVEPWASDGTAAGTYRLADIAPGSAGSGTACAPVFAGGTFFFVARAPTTGFELWRTDGTANGTALVRDVNPGLLPGALWSASQSMFPPAQAGSGTLLLFAGADPGSGVEVWRSDGTAGGTARVSDLRPGPASTTPRAFARTGRRLTLSSDDGARGHELFALDLAALGGVLAAPFGAGCAGTQGHVPRITASGLPTVGSTFTVQLSQARPQTAWSLLLGGAGARVRFPGGCTLHVLDPFVLLTALTDTAGEARVPLPIPNVRQMAGADVFAQCVVADPAGAFFGIATFTDGLHLVIGR